MKQDYFNQNRKCKRDWNTYQLGFSKQLVHVFQIMSHTVNK